VGVLAVPSFCRYFQGAGIEEMVAMREAFERIEREMGSERICTVW